MACRRVELELVSRMASSTGRRPLAGRCAEAAATDGRVPPRVAG